MDKIIIGISYILCIYLLYTLIKIRKSKEKSGSSKIYILIVLILFLFVIWGIIRNFI